MRFDRKPKPEEFKWTARRLALFRSKAARAKARLSAAYPLFADQIELPPQLSEEEEAQRRQIVAIRAEQRLRDLLAAHWRHGRRQYFACDESTRAQIMLMWRAWSGPALPSYFIYVVEKHNGVAAARIKAARADTLRIRQAVWRDLRRNEEMNFGGGPQS